MRQAMSSSRGQSGWGGRGACAICALHTGTRGTITAYLPAPLPAPSALQSGSLPPSPSSTGAPVPHLVANRPPLRFPTHPAGARLTLLPDPHLGRADEPCPVSCTQLVPRLSLPSLAGTCAAPTSLARFPAPSLCPAAALNRPAVLPVVRIVRTCSRRGRGGKVVESAHLNTCTSIVSLLQLILRTGPEKQPGYQHGATSLPAPPLPLPLTPAAAGPPLPTHLQRLGCVQRPGP